MRINVQQELLGFDGKPLQMRESEDSDMVNMTLADAIMLSLTNGLSQENLQNGKDKFKRFSIGLRCQASHDSDGEMVLTSKEITMIVESAERCLPVVTFGRLVEIIEPDYLKDD